MRSVEERERVRMEEVSGDGELIAGGAAGGSGVTVEMS